MSLETGNQEKYQLRKCTYCTVIQSILSSMVCSVLQRRKFSWFIGQCKLNLQRQLKYFFSGNVTRTFPLNCYSITCSQKLYKCVHLCLIYAKNASSGTKVELKTFSTAVTTIKVSRYLPLSYGVPVRERYGSTLLQATREQHDQNCTQSH